MYELIKIEISSIGGETVQTVNARELHEFLESKQQFSDWIKKRLEKYDFIENIDYICVSENYETQRSTGQKGISVRKEYYVTVDAAKELSMIENNEKGREARRYFIKCEKKLQQALSSKYSYQLDIINASTEKERMVAFNNYEVGYVQPLEKFKEEAEPKVDFYDITVASSSTVDIGEAAKILKYKETGRNNLFKFLRREGVLMKNNAPKQEYVNKGWFKLVEYKVNGEVKIKTLVHLSALPNRKSGMSLFRDDYQKGLDGIRKMLDEAGLLPEER